MMQSLVLQYVLSSLQSGMLALVVLLVCSLLRKSHTPSRYLCWLWLVVGARFVLPGVPLALPRRTETALSKTADALRTFSAAAGAADPSAAGPVTGTLLPAVAAPADLADAVSAPAVIPWYDRLTVWHFLTVLWAAVVCILLLRAVVGYLRLSRKMVLAYRTPDGAYTCDAVRTPFTMGFLRPHIYLPPDLTGSARRHVLAHEATHIRRGDTVTKPLFYLIACLHWFNPLVWLAYRQFLRVIECACDEVALQGLPKERREDYCKVILHFAAVPRQAAPGSLSFGCGQIKERITRAIYYRRPGRGRLTVCALAVLLTMTACMVQPTAADNAADTQGTAPAATPAPDAGTAGDEASPPENETTLSENDDSEQPAFATPAPPAAEGQAATAPSDTKSSAPTPISGSSESSGNAAVLTNGLIEYDSIYDVPYCKLEYNDQRYALDKNGAPWVIAPNSYKFGDICFSDGVTLIIQIYDTEDGEPTGSFSWFVVCFDHFHDLTTYHLADDIFYEDNEIDHVEGYTLYTEDGYSYEFTPCPGPDDDVGPR